MRERKRERMREREREKKYRRKIGGKIKKIKSAIMKEVYHQFENHQ